PARVPPPGARARPGAAGRPGGHRHRQVGVTASVHSDRERDLVELVTDTGRAAGADTVAAAHRPPGRMHRAFSVLLLDPAGRLLLQQRSAAKTRFPLRWANACCGHPAPGAPVAAEASRRVVEELGVRGVELTELGT